MMEFIAVSLVLLLFFYFWKVKSLVLWLYTSYSHRLSIIIANRSFPELTVVYAYLESDSGRFFRLQGFPIRLRAWEDSDIMEYDIEKLRNCIGSDEKVRLVICIRWFPVKIKSTWEEV